MNCRDFPLLYSAQLDGHAAEHDQFALQRHLRECIVCRRCAAEMRSLRADLRALAAPQAEPELTRQIQRRLWGEAARSARTRPVSSQVRNVQSTGSGISRVELRNFWFNTFANWLDGYRAKIFSQSVGAIVSLLLFFVVVTVVFKQATLALTTLATQTIFEDPNDKALRYQALLKAALLPSPPPPALNANDEFQGAVASLGEKDVILTAEVRQDGAATIMYVVPPNDPSVQAKLSTAMAQRGMFQGAKPNQNISTVAVVYLSSMTTTARL
ncbi:MAG: anti-sigma factor [Blastocatellales bacterium]